ncbi:MAG: branched-chain amino acid ABC transporter permease [Accumulibacter sp.]|jgi:branched-chain amino acid transport system permease protein
MMSELVLSWLFHTAQLAVIAAGVSLAVRVAGYFSFVPLAGCLVGSFLAGAVAQRMEGVCIAAICGALGAAGVGWIGWFHLHRRLAGEPLAQLLISLGASQVVQAAVALVAGDELKVLTGIGVNRVWWSLAGALVFLVFFWTWERSAWGRVWRGCATNCSLATILGIPTTRYVAGAFAAGSALCAVGTMAYAADTGYHTNFAFPIFLRGVTAAVVGGLGRPAGLLAAAACVAGAQVLTGYFLSTQWTDAVVFVILIGFLIWKPLGFGGRRLRKVQL